MKVLKRSIGIVIFLMLAVCFLCLNASAATIVDSGECGDGVIWTLDESGVLTITREPDGSGDITECPWDNEAVKKIVIKKGIHTIATNAFQGCTNLQNVMLPDTLYSIGIRAFAGCSNLKSIVIPDTVEEIMDAAFAECDKLQDVTLSNGLIRIGDDAFRHCISLEKIVLPESLEWMYYTAFDQCSALVSIRIPSKTEIEAIQFGLFQRCSSLRKIEVSEDNPYYSSVSGVLFDASKKTLIRYPEGKIDSSYAIPNTVKTINQGAFIFAKNITSITVPSSVTRIKMEAFAYCTNLSKVTLPEGLKAIENSLFDECTSLKSISIPQSVTSIECSFQLSGLKEITIPSNVNFIDCYAFSNCNSLKSITFTGSAPKIEFSAFGRVNAKVYYNSNKNWPSSARQNYGGNLTWVAYTPEKLEITTQPKTTYTQSGATAIATVKATGDGLTYQWYIRKPTDTAYTKSSVASATYSCVMSEKTKDRRVYCVIKDQYGNQVQTNTVLLRMAATITKQPTNARATVGLTAKTKVTAVGDGLTYQWYIKNPGATTFSKSSVTEDTYSCKMTESNNGRQAYCVVTDKYGKTDKSNIITLTVADPVKIITQPKTTYTKQGATAKATVTAVGDGLTYTWYIKNAGATTYGKSSVTSATYSVTMSSAAKDRIVYCVVKDKYGNTVESEKVRLRMAATITTQPKNASAAKGSTAKTSVTAVGDGLTYTWYIKNAGGSSFSKSSVTTASYSCKMSATTDGRQAYCVVTDKYGKTVKSNTVTLIMK